MNEDPNLSDVYQLSYEAAIELEKGEDYGEDVGIYIIPIEIEYPTEIVLEATN